MVPLFENELPIYLGGINATLIVYAHTLVFRLKGHIYPFRCPLPPERTIALSQLLVVQQEMRVGGGHLIITPADEQPLTIVYSEHQASQADKIYQMIRLYLKPYTAAAGVS